MHACLNVDEIVRLIVRELVWSRETGATVALACRCKSFEDSALDTLWHYGRRRIGHSRYSSLFREMFGTRADSL